MKIDLKKYNKLGNRKVDIHIDPWDTWSMDSTLAMIIYPMLLQLKATKQGVPAEFAEVGGEEYAVQSCFDFYKDEDSRLFDQRCKQWDEVLDKMIWAFYQIAYVDYSSKYHHGSTEYDWVETDKMYPNPITGVMEKTYQLVDKDPNSSWYDSVGHQLHEERIQEGIDLFAKYFRNLWD